MKKFLAFVVFMGFVVGALGSQQIIKVPDSLPIGTAFPPAGTMFNLQVGSADDEGMLTESYLHTNVLYTPDMGKLEDAARAQIAILVKAFAPLPGTETLRHFLDVDINDRVVPEIEGTTPPFSIGWSHGNVHMLVKTNGKWAFPADAVSKMVIGFQPDIIVYAPGLVETTLVRADEKGNELYSDISPNGILDVTCSEYPGGSAYIPDALMVPFGIANSTYYSWHRDWTLPRGYYYLRFGPDKSVWAKYDLETGKMLGTNRPKSVPLKLNIELVKLEGIKLFALTSQKSALKGIKLSVVGSSGQSGVIEYSEDLGVWQKLKDVSLVNGSAEYVDELTPSTPARFYRVK